MSLRQIGTAITVRNLGTDTTITSTGSLNGSNFGIQADNQSGALTISAVDVTGNYSSGIDARNQNAGTDLSITTSGTVSGTSGIITRNDGSGAATIDVVDAIGTSEEGVAAYARGTSLSVMSSGAVTGERRGIRAVNEGSGALTVSAVDATGNTMDGIDARNEAGSTDLTITTSGTISGGFRGVYARNYGNGTLRLSASGAITGSTGPGILTHTNPGGMSVITLERGASVSSSSGEAITNNDGNSRVNLVAGSSVAGSVQLNGGDDALTLDGGADISAATLFDGGAGTQDVLTFSAFNGTFGGALFTNWETLIADNGSALTVDGAAADLELLRVQNNSRITAASADLALNGALDVGGTGRFLAGFDGTGDVRVAGNVLNNGLISLTSGQSGDQLTVGGNLSGGGRIALDVDFSNGLADQIVVTGDSAGANQRIQVEKSGNGLGQNQKITIATVTGANTSGDFQLANGDFVTRNGQSAVSSGQFAYALEHDAASGTFALSPFDNPGGEFLATGVAQFSDQIALKGALRRLSGQTGSASGANTVSRTLIDLSTREQPLFWFDVEGGYESYSFDDREAETTSGGLRFGAALPLAEIAGGTLVGGAEIGITSLSTTTKTTVVEGDIDTEAYDLTLSALWIADNQLYLDSQLRYAFFDSTTQLNGGQEVSSDADGFAASIEVGKIYTVSNDLSLIPQAQLLYSSIDAGSLVDPSGRGNGGFSF